MSLLSICQDAARELKLAIPASIVSNTGDEDAQVLFRLAKKEGYLLSKRAEWTALRKEHTFLTVAADSQGTPSLPTDFEMYVDGTMYNRTSRRRVYGPITPAEWQEHKASLVTHVNPVFIVRGAQILMSPLQGVGDTVAYEYISTRWARDAADTEKLTFSLDTDTSVFVEEILTAGLIWRYRAQMGFEHETARLEYERMVADRIMRDGIRPRLQLADGAMPPRGKAVMQDYNTISG